MKKNLFKSCQGFTLIEFILAGGVFALVFALITSIFLSALRMHYSIIEKQRVQDDLRYFLDMLSRDVRVSKILVNGISGEVELDHPVKGMPTINIRYVYDFNSKRIKFCEEGPGNGRCDYVTSNDIIIDFLQFTKTGVGFEGWGVEGIQPRVTVNVRARSANPKYADSSEVVIQTTLSQKILDVSK